MANEEVSCEINAYAICITNKGNQGTLVERHRGFNRFVHSEFTQEENHVMFTTRENARKAILTFEHAYATWYHLRQRANQGELNLTSEMDEELNAKLRDAYNISHCEEKNLEDFRNELKTLTKTLEEENLITDETVEKLVVFIRISSLACPKVMVLTVESFELVAAGLKACLLKDIEMISNAQLVEHRNLYKLSDVITNFFEPRMKGETWRRITTISMGRSKNLQSSQSKLNLGFNPMVRRMDIRLGKRKFVKNAGLIISFETRTMTSTEPENYLELLNYMKCDSTCAAWTKEGQPGKDN